MMLFRKPFSFHRFVFSGMARLERDDADLQGQVGIKRVVGES